MHMLRYFRSVCRPSRWLRLAVLGAVWGGIQLLPAALLVPLSIEQMAGQAQLVVRGKVLDRSCDRDSAGRIYTRIELEVFEVWKGTPAGPRLAIVHGGGQIGNRSVKVAGQVDYPVGQEVVAFLVLNSRGQAVTLGLAQGKFEVWTDRSSGRQRARNPFHGQAPPGPDRIATVTATAAVELTLDELKKRVQGGSR